MRWRKPNNKHDKNTHTNGFNEAFHEIIPAQNRRALDNRRIERETERHLCASCPQHTQDRSIPIQFHIQYEHISIRSIYDFNCYDTAIISDYEEKIDEQKRNNDATE